jgi:HlyD family secretion protein
MLIVPASDRLVIDAKVAPQNIDQVYAGQAAHVRFSAFNQRTTPEIEASVLRVSADLMVDAVRPGAEVSATGGMPYYSVRLVLTEAELLKLGGLKLVPGMPAEVHITTDERTALSYFAKPLSDQFSRAFRER